MKELYTTIPVSLCEYALMNQKVNHLAFFLYLKHKSDGHIEFDTRQYEYWAVDINKSKKWVRNTIKWLIKNKWICVNSKRNVLRIISYKNLCKKLNLRNSISAIYEQNDFSDFRGFCSAVIITYNLKTKQWMEKKRWSASNMVDANTNRYSFPKGFYSMPLSYLAKRLGTSASTIDNFKRVAKKYNYIEVKRQLKILTDDNGNQLSKDLLYGYRKSHPEIAGRLRAGKKYLKLVDSDIIKSSVILKRKRYKYTEKM